jgi:hypothetical protein
MLSTCSKWPHAFFSCGDAATAEKSRRKIPAPEDGCGAFWYKLWSKQKLSEISLDREHSIKIRDRPVMISASVAACRSAVA